MLGIVGRHGFAVMVAISVAAHAAVAVCFSLDESEPPVALPSFIGKASMSIRASRAARPRVIGDGGAVLKTEQHAAADPKPPTPVADRKDDVHPAEPAPVATPPAAAPNPTKKPSHKPAPAPLESPIKRALSEWASRFPPPPKAPAPSPEKILPPEADYAAVDAPALPIHVPEKPPAPTPLPPRPKTEVPRAEAKPAADAPASVPKPAPAVVPALPLKTTDPTPAGPTTTPAKDQDVPASNRPPTGLTPGSPAVRGTENAKEIADEASAPSGGSVGSEGVEADGLPVGLAVNPPPPYPPDALAAGLEGRVVLWVKIDATGRVSAIHVHESSGVDSLDRSALNTIRRWQFRPATRRGSPVPFEFLKPVSFSIAGR